MVYVVPWVLRPDLKDETQCQLNKGELNDTLITD